MKLLRSILITALIIVLGTATAFADIASFPPEGSNAKWYIIAAIVIIIIAVSLLRSAIKKKAEKTEAELKYGRYENMEALYPAVGAAPDPQFSGVSSDERSADAQESAADVDAPGR